jgi:ketosteroid isomerase-like protein
MAEHPNAEIVRKLTEGMQDNPQAAAEVVADDVEWHEIGRAEPIMGKAALEARMTGGAVGEYKFDGETHDIIAGDDHTVALFNVTVTRGDESFSYRVAEVYHIQDGKISARWAMSDDTERINKIFSDWPA